MFVFFFFIKLEAVGEPTGLFLFVIGISLTAAWPFLGYFDFLYEDTAPDLTANGGTCQQQWAACKAVLTPLPHPLLLL